jgi:peptidoglycan/xylan/chitin deacetylase (PgdA/CDA1 family)
MVQPSSYAFVPLPDRAPLKFPNGAHVALIFTINIEYWEPFRVGQKEPLFPGGPAIIPHALPGDVLDTANWTWREYGQRIGIWRLMEAFDTLGVAPSCTCNGIILQERRRIIDAVKERGWELVPHNWVQNDLLTYYAYKPAEERAVIRRTLDKYAEVVGKPAKAWLSSAIRGTPHTPAFLKEFGLIAYCDYLNDDQPYLIDTVHGPIVCVPYSNDINDLQHVRARGPFDTRRCRNAQALFRSTLRRRRTLRTDHERRPASACYRSAAPDCRAARVHRIYQRTIERVVSDPRADRLVVSRRSGAAHAAKGLNTSSRGQASKLLKQATKP